MPAAGFSLAIGLWFLAISTGAVLAQAPAAAPARALILRAGQPEGERNERAYANLFDTVGIAWQAYDLRRAYAAALAEARIIVVPAAAARRLTAAQVQGLLAPVGRGAVLLTEGITPLSGALGFRAASLIPVERLEETSYPEVEIVWQRPERLPALRTPAEAAILTREKQTRLPLAALARVGRGHALVLAAELDPIQGEGYARFPYVLHALRRAGVHFLFRSERLALFFDYGYRWNANPEALARRWRQAGVQSVHASAWHFYEPNAQREDYLRRLIAACHRNGILVYAWLEPPHISESFYRQNPAWREKTAALLDARFDWRLPVNLLDPACFRAAAQGVRRLLEAFDWDGVNLAELYFESPLGPDSPAYFTPFNSLVRAEFTARYGVDPVNFFRHTSPHYWKKDQANWSRFVSYRVEKIRLLHERWLDFLAAQRTGPRSHLDIVVTFVDNIYDPGMGEALGVDVRQIVPLLDRYDFTLIMEDPYSVWHLGPRRYAELAGNYERLTSRARSLGIDINIVERDNAFPTRKQTGTELLQLFRHAAANFETVLAYSEQSIFDQDFDLIAHALAAGASAKPTVQGMVVKSARPVVFRSGIQRASQVVVNGRPWPCTSGEQVLLPAGEHRVAAVTGPDAPAPRLLRLNGDLLEARYADTSSIAFTYRSRARAIAVFDRRPRRITVDGGARPADSTVLLPPGGPHAVVAVF